MLQDKNNALSLSTVVQIFHYQRQQTETSTEANLQPLAYRLEASLLRVLRSDTDILERQ